jgi:O-antigen/teichoic acid export membrane protein
MDKLWLAIFSVLAGVLNYLLQIIVGRGLSVSDFGEFNTINSFATNAINIFLPLCVIACRITAENHGKLAVNRKIHRQLLTIISITSLVILGCAVGGVLLGLFGTESLMEIMCVCVYLIIMAYYNYVLYVIQGMQLFFWYGFGGFLLAALKALFSVISIRQDGGLDGIVIALILGYAVVILLGAFIIFRFYKKDDEAEKKPFTAKYLLDLYSVTFVAQLVFSLYVYNGEILIMRPFYSEHELGIYSSASLLGKASIYICTILTTVILPKIAEIREDVVRVKKTFVQTMGLCVVISILYAAAFFLLGEFAIRILLGAEYRGAGSYIVSLTVLVIPMNLNILIYYFLLAINRIKRYTVCMVVLLAATVGVIALFHPTISANVMIWAGVMMVNAVVGIFSIRNYIKAEE